MKCPKCHHVQAEAQECRKCGLIFAKFEAFEKKKKEQAEQKKATEQRRSSSFGRALQIIIVVILAAGGGYYFANQKSETLPQSKSTTLLESPDIHKDKATDRVVTEGEGRDAEKSTSMTVVSPIEKARRATVSIETPWGTGSGFFVARNYVVTNKHVVEFKNSELAELREKIETSRKLIDLEAQKLKDLRRRMRKMASGPSKSQLDIIIKEREKELTRYQQQQEEGERRLAKLERDLTSPEINVILSDGSVHGVGIMLKSQNYDLALLSLFSHDGEFLHRPPSDYRMQQGDKVYTVGSPVGLRHTVTSGVFSGLRQRESDKQVFLQTDAPINPGNSGGPLIDENGFVHGVNTMILRNTEGIGFAIPINTVFEEFGSTLQ